MKALPVRVRLTAWYFAVLTVTFCVFGIITYFEMRGSVLQTVDADLHAGELGVHRLMDSKLPCRTDELKHALHEHSSLRPGGDLLQVADGEGNWIYRSQSIMRYGVPGPLVVKAKHATLELDGVPVRVLTKRVDVKGHTYYVQTAEAMGGFARAIGRFRLVLLLSLPVLLLLASVGGYWMSRRALSPVDQITRAAQSVSAQNLSYRLAVPQTRDELQRLSETLNGMLARLEKGFKQIAQFTADASHELRTPVALMRTSAEIALRKPRSEADYRQTLGQIHTELERTSDLIEKLMLLARADAGVEALEHSEVDLAESVRAACRQGRRLAEAKDIAFHEEVNGLSVRVAGDGESLERLFLILIDNAVKYTPASGEVRVSLRADDGHAVSEIFDTGIGIADADRSNIFERFYRADKARSRESGGAGLGLSIGRWIAEAHGGSIEVESALGQGSVFRVRLPILNRPWGAAS